MSNMSLADRLVAVMQRAEYAKEESKRMTDRASDSPRFEIDMAIDEQINGLHQAFASAWSNIDRLAQVAKAIAQRGAEIEKEREP